MQTDLAPIVLFVYNRPWHTRQCLESLSRNELAKDSILYIYADGPKENASDDQLQKIKEVRALIREVSWCKAVHIIESSINNGLAFSIINGVTEILSKLNKIIVLEDDLVLSKGFLKFMNETLEFYKNHVEVMHVSGYMFPVKSRLPDTFFIYGTTCWGWGTWSRAWTNFESDASLLAHQIETSQRIKEFDLYDSYNYFEMLISQTNKKIDSWAIRWYASVFLKRGLCLHPSKSLVQNIGNDGSGIHSANSKHYAHKKLADEIPVNEIPIVTSDVCLMALKKYYSDLQRPEWRSRIRQKLWNY